ncbi:hypothetical protein Xen7305DRAFT_00021540 [Xenococcus sp. PCC 7305]|uniref:PKD domain-containing protein n=1 Tax=Xenococcus sp. PCC 7305 TaxID=102125 RepID=UPI0002AC2F23|nr:PKD domain-containing protein [Xenococcus sp. PCC 7305]ELS02440.1 hypothetical protein Xen7305DRAFT_00021540 [Xenococcus sp. PCC 7305]
MMLGFVPRPNLQICDRAEGIETTITAIASDPGNDLLTYSWNFGDNTDIADPIRLKLRAIAKTIDKLISIKFLLVSWI